MTTSSGATGCGVTIIGSPCGRPLSELRTETGEPACIFHGFAKEKPAAFWAEVLRLMQSANPRFDGFVFPALPPGWFNVSAKEHATFYRAQFLGDMRFGEFPKGVGFHEAHFAAHLGFTYFGPYASPGRPPADFVLDPTVHFDFTGATFASSVSFGGSSSFGRALILRSAQFKGPVVFYGFEVWSDVEASGAIFYDSFDTMGTFAIPKKANFSYAVFYGKVNLGGVITWPSQTLDLTGAHFHDEVSVFTRAGSVNVERATFEKPVFSPGYRSPEHSTQMNIQCMGTKFRGGVDFSNNIFEGSDFSRSNFGGDANFTDCTFPTGISFEGVSFAEGADFSRVSVGTDTATESAVFDLRNARFLEPHRVSLRQANHRNGQPLRLRLLNANPEKISLEGVHWWQVEERLQLQDEADLHAGAGERPSHELVATCYRRLTTNFEAGRAHDKAEQCIYRVFELLRTDPTSKWHKKTLLFAYRGLSGYGGSYARALLWLVIAILGFAVAYASLGLAPTVAQHESVASVPASVSRAEHVRNTLIPGVLHSLEVATFRRNPTYRVVRRSAHFVELMQLIVVPAQAALLLLAVRRSFRA